MTSSEMDAGGPEGEDRPLATGWLYTAQAKWIILSATLAAVIGFLLMIGTMDASAAGGCGGGGG